MEKGIFQNYEPEQRKQMLEDNCEEMYKSQYSKKFSVAERNAKMKENANLDIQLQQAEQEFQDVKDFHKEKIKALKSKKSKVVDEIKAGGTWVEGTVYKMVDYEAKEVRIYNEDGDCIEERKMTSADKQRKMKFTATGTEDN